LIAEFFKMNLKELLKKVIEFRDARDWEQRNQMTEDGGRRLAIAKLAMNEKKYA
jgi:hypothetical protein